MTATSRALQCLELRQLICEQIGSNDKCSLYRLSQTCKSFMEPALDELWYKLDNFSPLLFCMPEDLYEEHVQFQHVTEQEIVTLVSDSFLPHPLVQFYICRSLFEGQCNRAIGRASKQQQRASESSGRPGLGKIKSTTLTPTFSNRSLVPHREERGYCHGFND